MKQRIITSGIGLCIILPCIIFSNTIAFDIFIALCSAVATFEIINCTKKFGMLSLSIPSIILGLVFPFFARRIIGFDFFTKSVIIFAVIYFIFVMSLALFSRGRFKVDDAMIISGMVIYTVVAFSSILFLRDVTSDGRGIGMFLILAVFFAAWFPDAGAYFVGVKFGKTPLIPDVSPKKTVEGLIGGFATNIIIFIIYTIIIDTVFHAELNAFLMILLSIVLTFVSVVGDLLASYVKRHYNTKDYGMLLPGHGGIMDRFDSVLSTSLVMFIIVLLTYYR